MDSESVVWQCVGCAATIDPDEDVDEYVERQFNRVGDTNVAALMERYAHTRHRSAAAAGGYAPTGESGPLRDVRARRRRAPLHRI